MKHLYPLLKEIEPRPALWIGEYSLNGYSLALAQHKLLPLEEDTPNFHEWVAYKLGFYESTAGWHNMILAVTLGWNPTTIQRENYAVEVSLEQHKRSIQLFYTLLDEFVTH